MSTKAKTKSVRRRATRRGKGIVTSENFEAMLIASATQARQIAREGLTATRMSTRRHGPFESPSRVPTGEAT